jgi:hypothetical protein
MYPTASSFTVSFGNWGFFQNVDNFVAYPAVSGIGMIPSRRNRQVPRYLEPPTKIYDVTHRISLRFGLPSALLVFHVGGSFLGTGGTSLLCYSFWGKFDWLFILIPSPPDRQNKQPLACICRLRKGGGYFRLNIQSLYPSFCCHIRYVMLTCSCVPSRHAQVIMNNLTILTESNWVLHKGIN